MLLCVYTLTVTRPRLLGQTPPLHTCTYTCTGTHTYTHLYTNLLAPKNCSESCTHSHTLSHTHTHTHAQFGLTRMLQSEQGLVIFVSAMDPYNENMMGDVLRVTAAVCLVADG